MRVSKSRCKGEVGSELSAMRVPAQAVGSEDGTVGEYRLHLLQVASLKAHVTSVWSLLQVPGVTASAVK